MQIKRRPQAYSLCPVLYGLSHGQKYSTGIFS